MPSKRRTVSSISILICLILAILSMMHLGYASQTIEISQWTVFPSEVKTYEPMIMQISIYNPDSVDHYYSLSLSTTVGGIFHGWSGHILTTDGYVDAYCYAHISIVLYPSKVPYGGEVKFELGLIQDDPTHVGWLLVIGTEYKWVSVSEGELEKDIDSLKSNITSLEERVGSLEANYYTLENQFSDYQQTHNYTNSQYESLQTSYEDLESRYQAVGDPVIVRNLMYIFLITTVTFIATTVYLVTRKPKTKP